MKKKMLCMALIALMMVGIVPAQATELYGGSDSPSAKLIETWQYGTEYQVKFGPSLGTVQYWYIVSAPCAGDYVFTYKDSVSWSSTRIEFFDSLTGESIKGAIDLETTKETLEIHVEGADQIIFIAIYSEMTGTSSTVTFSVCFDGYHGPLGVRSFQKAATCKETGEYVYKCTQCGRTAKVEEVPLIEHKLVGEEQLLSAADCTQSGWLGKRCDLCDESVRTKEIPSTGHMPQEETMLKAATCIETGISAVLCKVCGETISEKQLPIGEHIKGIWIEVKAAACEAGLRVQRCAICGETLNTEEIPAQGHRYADWIVLAEPTTEQFGEKVRYCLECGEAQSQIIPQK